MICTLDPKIGAATGFGGVVLHGLATLGFAARAVINAVGGGDPTSLRLFGVRFTSPVKPGDALETSVWEVGSGPNGTTEVTFVTKNVATGKVRLRDVGNAIVALMSAAGVPRLGDCVCEEGGEKQTVRKRRRMPVPGVNMIYLRGIWISIGSRLHPL